MDEAVEIVLAEYDQRGVEEFTLRDRMSEDEWMNAVATRGVHGMMMWGDLRALTPADRHAIYAFIRGLGAAGTPSLPDVKPWDEPRTPYIDVRERLPQR